MSIHRFKITSHVRSVIVALLAVPVLFVGIATLQARIDVLSAPLTQEKDELLLRSGPLLKKLSLGYDPLLADIYWTRVVQYYGARVQARKGSFESLGPLLDITTTLDPKLMIAYRFGAIFLSENPPGGAGRPDLAVNLVKKGIAANPNEWRLYQDLGFLYYAHLKDYPKASEAFLEGSRNPDAAIWMKVMAARVAETGESLETSRFIWAEIFTSTKDVSIRKRAMLHVESLDAAIDLKRLNQASEDYWRKFGRFPTSIQELRDAGLAEGNLEDAAGYPYVMGTNGVPELSPRSTVMPEQEPKKP
ncbi:MAG: hypothetical protein WA211_14785 [Candidatus Acidiferrales bacterium]